MISRFNSRSIAHFTCFCLATLVFSFSHNAIGSNTFLVSENTTLYRFQIGGPAPETFTAPGKVDGMTTVPAGVTTGNLAGGATAGDVLLLGIGHRMDNPLSATPSFTQVGTAPGPNNSPVFVGDKMYGIESGAPTSHIVEWNRTTWTETNRWPTGVFGGPGGLVHESGTTFLFTEFLSDQLWRYTLGGGPAVSVGTLPNHDYSGLERAIDGTIYASFALPGRGEMVFGTARASDAMFNEILSLGPYTPGPGDDGITGITIVVPEPASYWLLYLPLLSIVLRHLNAVRRGQLTSS